MISLNWILYNAVMCYFFLYKFDWKWHTIYDRIMYYFFRLLFNNCLHWNFKAHHSTYISCVNKSVTVNYITFLLCSQQHFNCVIKWWMIMDSFYIVNDKSYQKQNIGFIILVSSHDHLLSNQKSTTLVKWVCSPLWGLISLFDQSQENYNGY